jgi:hypothetical protein
MARQLSVQQQNGLAVDAMLAIAAGVRSEGLPAGLSRLLAAKGIRESECAVVYLETAGHMLSLEHGASVLLVTAEDRILEMEVELDQTLEEVLQVIEFRDITDAQNFSKSNPGTGWGWGAVALEVRKRLASSEI